MSNKPEPTPDRPALAAVRYEVVKSKRDPDTWLVEAIDFDDEGVCYATSFYGLKAKVRAKEYAAWMNARTPAPQPAPNVCSHGVYACNLEHAKPAPEIPERLLDVLSRWLWDVDWEHCLPESRDEVIEAAKEVLEAMK